LDVEDINAGRFESVILNQLGTCDNFIVLLTPATCSDLQNMDDWVR
jgi:hypothetical protein